VLSEVHGLLSLEIMNSSRTSTIVSINALNSQGASIIVDKMSDRSVRLACFIKLARAIAAFSRICNCKFIVTIALP